MRTSPYDSLPSGNNDIPPKTANTPMQSAVRDTAQGVPNAAHMRNVAQSVPHSAKAEPNAETGKRNLTQSTPNIAHGEQPAKDNERNSTQNVPYSTHDSESDERNVAQDVPNAAPVLEYVEVSATELDAANAQDMAQTVPRSAQDKPADETAERNSTQNVSHSAHVSESNERNVAQDVPNAAPVLEYIEVSAAELDAANAQDMAQTVPHSAQDEPTDETVERNLTQSAPNAAHGEQLSKDNRRNSAQDVSYSATVSEPAVRNIAQPVPHSAAKPPKTCALDTPPQYTHINIKNLQCCTEYILPFEESLLVPDTMPDMQKVLFAEGRADLAQPGKLNYDINDFLSGSITAYTVYKPVPPHHSELAGPAAFDETPVDVIKSAITFKTDKCWDEAAGDTFRVKATIKNITAEMINERKFVIKGEILFTITSIADHELKTFKNTGDNNLITKSDSISVTALEYETSDNIEISQEITAAQEHGKPLRILKTSIDIIETHKQITSGKLVINASINSQILYAGEKDDGEKKLYCLDNKTDFTQFVAVSETSNPDLMKLTFNNDLNITIEEPDKFLLHGNVTTLIQSYANRDIDMVCDAYHKQRTLDFNLETLQLNSVAETVSGEISAREVATLPDTAQKPETFLCGSCHIASINGHIEKGRIVIDGAIPAKIMALDSGDNPLVIEHTVPIRGALAITSDIGQASCACIDVAVKEFWFNEINSRQVEINTALAITVWLENEVTFCTIENLCFAEEENPPRKFSMAVYVVGREDTLWSVAKRYRTDMESLAALNEIDPQMPLPAGTKLLIAK